jgi:hypothetical protein
MASGDASGALFLVYSIVMLIETTVGGVLCARTCITWTKVYKRVTPVVQSYVLIFIPDLTIIIVFWSQSLYGLVHGTTLKGPGR